MRWIVTGCSLFEQSQPEEEHGHIPFQSFLRPLCLCAWLLGHPEPVKPIQPFLRKDWVWGWLEGRVIHKHAGCAAAYSSWLQTEVWNSPGPLMGLHACEELMTWGRVCVLQKVNFGACWLSRLRKRLWDIFQQFNDNWHLGAIRASTLNTCLPLLSPMPSDGRNVVFFIWHLLLWPSVPDL